MKEKEVRAIKISPQQLPEVVCLGTTRKELCEAVSIEADGVGSVQRLDLEKGVVLLCHEEGKLLGLPPNRKIVICGKVCDVICGTFYIAGVNEMNGTLCSLADKHIRKYMLYFWTPEPYTSEMERLVREIIKNPATVINVNNGHSDL